MISALVVTYLFHRNEWMWRGPVKVIAIIASAVALPVVLRQLQVIRTFGWEFWARDLYFTALIKTAIGNRLVRLSSYEEINAFYRSRHAVRFVAFQSPGTRHTLNVGASLWKEHWIPYLGWLRWRVSVASFVWAVVIVTP